MAIKVMSRVWDFSNQAASDLLLLLALADRADDDGICWPGIKSLAQKTRSSERQTQRNLSKLEDRGELYIAYQQGKAGGRGNTNRYCIVSGLTLPEIADILKRRFEMDGATAQQAALDMIQRQSTYQKGDIDDTHKKGDIGDIKRVTSRAEKGDIAMTPDSSKNPSLDTSPTTTKDDPFKKICNLYQAEIGSLSPLISDMIKDDVDTYPVEWIERAIAIAVSRNNRKWSYVRGILKNWQAIGGPQNDGPKQKAHGSNGHRPAVKSNQPIPMDTDFYDRWEKGQ